VTYRVLTKEWCGFKNLLNDYILQLDGAAPPPFSPDCTWAPQAWSSTALDRTYCKRRQPHTHTIWDEFDYRVDVCRVTQGAHIEGLWLMHKKNLDICRCWRCTFFPCKVRNFLLIFETAPFFFKHPVYTVYTVRVLWRSEIYKLITQFVTRHYIYIYFVNLAHPKC
jgi:hypothetical protein